MLKTEIENKLRTKDVVFEEYDEAYNAWQDDMDMCVVEDVSDNAVHVLVKDRVTIDQLIALNNCGKYVVFYILDTGEIPQWAEGMDIIIGKDDWYNLFG